MSKLNENEMGIVTGGDSPEAHCDRFGYGIDFAACYWSHLLWEATHSPVTEAEE